MAASRWLPAPRAASAEPSRSPSPPPARTSSPWRAPRARSKSSTTRSARCGRRPKIPRPWSPAIFAITRRSTGWARPSTVAGAVSTSWSPTRARSGRCRRCITSIPSNGTNVFSLNVTANWRLIRALDPLLRQSPAGRAVFVTSAAASRAELRAYWGPYAVSKAALDALARTYAAETVNTSPIRVMLVNPGPLRTRMRASAMPGEDPASLRTPEELAPKIAAALLARLARNRQTLRFPAGQGHELRAARVSVRGEEKDFPCASRALVYKPRDRSVPLGAERKAAAELHQFGRGRAETPGFPCSRLRTIRLEPFQRARRAQRGTLRETA